jgi:hypothetical protein
VFVWVPVDVPVFADELQVGILDGEPAELLDWVLVDVDHRTSHHQETARGQGLQGPLRVPERPPVDFGTDEDLTMIQHVEVSPIQVSSVVAMDVVVGLDHPRDFRWVPCLASGFLVLDGCGELAKPAEPTIDTLYPLSEGPGMWAMSLCRSFETNISAMLSYLE